MKVLIVADAFPAPDRNSADFRFSSLLRMLAGGHQVSYCVLGVARQIEDIGTDATNAYRRLLTEHGLDVLDGSIDTALQQHRYDVVLFEWHFPAPPLLDLVRMRQPRSRIVIDSVDVVFNRLRAKARVSGLEADRENARQTRMRELDVYRRADLVLTVSDEDSEILSAEDASIRTFTIPNIHPLHARRNAAEVHEQTLVFVGSRSEANDDAVRFFCDEVLPLILQGEPDVRCRIAGTVTVPELDGNVAAAVDRLGFVPDTLPWLASSLISIAPLRFGGGMKGKVGEAMSMRLPVVTTSTGAEGFGLEPGREALVVDDARGFADAVLRLLREPELRERIAEAGWQFIREHYSDLAVGRRVDQLLVLLSAIEPKPLRLTRRYQLEAEALWRRHVGWRLGR